MLTLREPHATRPIRCLELWEPEGWRLKVYSIAYGRGIARPEVVEAAKRITRPALPPPHAGGNHGVGWLGVHDGRGANFAFLDWWADENELHHHVWIAPGDKPTSFAPAPGNNPSVCVWDLAVQWHEREAWVRHILANTKGPDVESYLAQRLDADL
jgi:hypothetical protein